MTKEEHKLKIGKRHQLVDLNRDNTNFRLHFQCTSSLPEQSFQLCVASQKDLDSMEMANLPFKDVIGTMSGNIVSDKNQYENYFVVLRSEEECEVTVEIDLEPMGLIEMEEPKEIEKAVNTPLDWKKWVVWIFILALIICIFIYISRIQGLDPESIVDEINNI